MSNTPAPSRRYLTLTDAGAITRLSTRTLRRAIDAKHLVAQRIGRLIRIDEDELHRWMAAGGLAAPPRASV